MTNKRRLRIEKYRKLIDYLMDHPCEDCGEDDPLVLQFDHVRGKKTSDINKLIHNGYSWDRILTEMKLCEVRCGNCHIRQSAVRGQYTRWEECKTHYASMQKLEKLQGRKSAKVRQRKRLRSL